MFCTFCADWFFGWRIFFPQNSTCCCVDQTPLPLMIHHLTSFFYVRLDNLKEGAVRNQLVISNIY